MYETQLLAISPPVILSVGLSFQADAPYGPQMAATVQGTCGLELSGGFQGTSVMFQAWPPGDTRE